MMNLTREIVLDLLPLYLSGEPRKDTTFAVEAFLREDPEFAVRIVGMELPRLGQVPKPISKEVEMEAYKRANLVNAVRTIVLAVVLAGTALSVLLIVPLIFLMFR